MLINDNNVMIYILYCSPRKKSLFEKYWNGTKKRDFRISTPARPRDAPAAPRSARARK